MKPLPCYLCLLCFGVSTSLIQAQSYDFENNNEGSILSQQSGWTSTDDNSSDGVESEQNLFFPGTSGSNVGIMGGYWSDEGNPITPSLRTSLLTASVSAVPTTDLPLLRFRWIQNISNTDQDNGRRDTFGWTVRSGDNDLLSLVCTPDSPSANSMTVQGYQGDTSGTRLGGLFTPNIATLLRGGGYAFQIEANPNTWTWSAKVSGSFGLDYDAIHDWGLIINNAAMGGTSGSRIDGFAAIWITQDPVPGNAGRNIMAFDNIEISTTVPEPSTLSLLTLGSLALLAARRLRSS